MAKFLDRTERGIDEVSTRALTAKQAHAAHVVTEHAGLGTGWLAVAVLSRIPTTVSARRRRDAGGLVPLQVDLRQACEVRRRRAGDARLSALDVRTARLRISRDERLGPAIGAGAAAGHGAGMPAARVAQQSHEPRAARAWHHGVRDRPVDSAEDALLVRCMAAVARTARQDLRPRHAHAVPIDAVLVARSSKSMRCVKQ